MQLIFGVEKSRVVISGACGVMGASVIAFAKLVKTNVLSAFLLSYAISVRIMEKKNFRKYISGTFIKECPAY